MPLIIPKDLPAYEELQQENEFVMHQERAMSQHIRPLRSLSLNLMPTKIVTETQLARLLANSSGCDRLFAKSRLDSEIKRPPLPLSIGQVGLIGGSGLINGLIECDNPHIVKGRIIKEKHTVTDENRGPHGRLISTEKRETISNRMLFNILTPSGFRSLT